MQSAVLPIFLGLYAVEQTADLGLLWLNLWRARRAHGVPDELGGLLDPAVAERARAYAAAGGLVAICRAAASALVTLGLLLSGVLPWIDAVLAQITDEPAHRFVLFLASISAAIALTELPFAAWRPFGVERRFGFSQMGPGRFLLCRLRGWGLAALLGLPFLYALHAVMALGGSSWWLWLFLLLAAIQLGLAWFWPAVVAPLLTPHRPLPPSELKARLVALAEAAGLRPDAILVVEASRRGGQPNARLTGPIRPRILLDDTLLARLSAEEIEAVVAHELGHYQLHHVAARLALHLAGLLVLLALLSRALAWPPLYAAFGFAGPSPHAAMALVSICGGAALFWLTPLQAWLARRQEAAADARAVALTGRPETLGAALLDLAEDALLNPWPHPWYVAWRLTHPPLVERIVALSPEADAQ
jgi:STE24 endopeptidase